MSVSSDADLVEMTGSPIIYINPGEELFWYVINLSVSTSLQAETTFTGAVGLISAGLAVLLTLV